MKTVSLLLILLVLSCGSTNRYVKFKPQENEIYTTNKLSDFLNKNKNPKVVLRTPYVGDVAEEENSFTKEYYNYIYSSVEKELLKQGFIVRDRNLFNEIIKNDQNSINYAELKKKTDTELIIEIVIINPSVMYETNRYYKDNGKTHVFKKPHLRYGAMVEYKIVLIDNNEFAGIYKFNYAPCAEGKGCNIESVFQTMKRLKKEGESPFERVEENELADFMVEATKELIHEMRN